MADQILFCFSRHSCPKHWPWSYKIFAYKTVRTKDWIIKGNGFRLTRRVPLVEQELLTLPDHLSSPPVFNGVHVTRSLVLYVCFCRSLFVLLYFFFWPLCCLFFFDIRILIAPFGIFKLFLQFFNRLYLYYLVLNSICFS